MMFKQFATDIPVDPYNYYAIAIWLIKVMCAQVKRKLI